MHKLITSILKLILGVEDCDDDDARKLFGNYQTDNGCKILSSEVKTSLMKIHSGDEVSH